MLDQDESKDTTQFGRMVRSLERRKSHSPLEYGIIAAGAAAVLSNAMLPDATLSGLAYMGGGRRHGRSTMYGKLLAQAKPKPLSPAKLKKKKQRRAQKQSRRITRNHQ